MDFLNFAETSYHVLSATFKCAKPPGASQQYVTLSMLSILSMP